MYYLFYQISSFVHTETIYLSSLLIQGSLVHQVRSFVLNIIAYRVHSLILLTYIYLLYSFVHLISFVYHSYSFDFYYSLLLNVIRSSTSFLSAAITHSGLFIYRLHSFVLLFICLSLLVTHSCVSLLIRNFHSFSRYFVYRSNSLGLNEFLLCATHSFTDSCLSTDFTRSPKI